MMSARQRACLDAMGIQYWEYRRLLEQGVELVEESAPEVEVAQHSSPVTKEAGVTGRADVSRLDWPELTERVATCQQCVLHGSRTQTVFGVGNREADWLIIGEAPGAEEDRRGEPFVGRAGQLLDAMLQAIGLDRQRAYIANILKCRPPNNRDPLPEEVVSCEPFLRRQIELIQPKVILAVGRIAAQNLLNSNQPIGRLRGQVHHFGEAQIPLIVTYHPAYLLRSPLEKRKAWLDLLLARRTLSGISA
jgi:uracil-DNA glycosylase family 4